MDGLWKSAEWVETLEVTLENLSLDYIGAIQKTGEWELQYRIDKRRCSSMPIDSIQIEVQTLRFQTCWPGYHSRGKRMISTLDWRKCRVIDCTHPKNPAILDAMVEMISSAKRHIPIQLDVVPCDREYSCISSKSIEWTCSCSDYLETSIHSRYSDDEESMNNLSSCRSLLKVYTSVTSRHTRSSLLMMSYWLHQPISVIPHLRRILRLEYELRLKTRNLPFIFLISMAPWANQHIDQVRMILDLAIHGLKRNTRFT